MVKFEATVTGVYIDERNVVLELYTQEIHTQNKITISRAVYDSMKWNIDDKVTVELT